MRSLLTACALLTADLALADEPPDQRLVRSGAILGGSGAALVLGTWYAAHHDPATDPVTGGLVKAANATGFALVGAGGVKIGFGLWYRTHPPSWAIDVSPTGADVKVRF